MDPNRLREEIMRRVGEHEATGSSTYMEDKQLASAIGVSLVDVQRQICILESNGLLDVAAAMGPSYGVRLTPQGELALEQSNGTVLTPRNPIGFSTKTPSTNSHKWSSRFSVSITSFSVAIPGAGRALTRSGGILPSCLSKSARVCTFVLGCSSKVAIRLLPLLEFNLQCNRSNAKAGICRPGLS
jgi:hypothetical protein